MLSRRQLLMELLTGICLVTSSSCALADGGSGGSGSGSGGSGSGSSNSGSGSGNSGSGSNNSGEDNGDGKDDNPGEQDEARSALLSGEATELRNILLEVKKKYSGDIVHIGLKRQSQQLVYLIKLIDPAGKMLLLRVDAKSGAILAEQGF